MRNPELQLSNYINRQSVFTTMVPVCNDTAPLLSQSKITLTTTTIPQDVNMHAGYFAIALQLVGTAWSLPSSGNTENSMDVRAPGDRGKETVAGLGHRKQAVLQAGGNTLDLAIAMLETKNMGTDYAYGLWPTRNTILLQILIKYRRQ